MFRRVGFVVGRLFRCYVRLLRLALLLLWLLCLLFLVSCRCVFFLVFSAVLAYARRSKRSLLTALSGGAERIREASRECRPCYLDALAVLAALALLLLLVLALSLFLF